jgi:hypothetical protein
MAIVYQHKRKDNDEIFYVGIGKNESRAYVKYEGSRGPAWRNYISKYEYVIEITHKDISWEEACSIEKYLISFYGRKDLGLGKLVNMTNGGEGITNVSRDSKNKMSNAKKGVRLSESHRRNIGLASKKRWDDEEFRRKAIELMKGRHHSEETRKKLSELKKGKPTWSKGKTHSDEHKRKNSESKIGKTFKKVECIHCGRFVAISKINLWHNDNCKLKNKQL